MKQLKYISIISIMALITAPAVADIASAEYVDSVVVKYSTGNTTKAGITKLYTGLGSNSDGTMTQGAITSALLGKQDKLPNGPNDGKKYSLIWNGSGFAFEEYTTGGGSTPIDWDAISAYIGDYESNPDYTYAGYGLNGEHCDGSAGYDEYEMYDKLFGTDMGGSCSDSEFAGMVAGDWYYDLPPMNVKIEGRVLCSSTEGSYDVAGNPDESDSGANCWCKMTSPAASRWVYVEDLDRSPHCAASCAFYCANTVQNESDFRSALFGSIEQ